MKSYLDIANGNDIVLALFLASCVFMGLYSLGHSNKKNMKDETAQLKAAPEKEELKESATPEMTDETQQNMDSQVFDNISNKVTVTAYSPRVSETDDTPMLTASMKRVREGTVAVSRDLFEDGWTFGRKVHIRGIGVFQINDLMAKRHQKRIDIFMWDTDKALEFGKQKATAALFDL